MQGFLKRKMGFLPCLLSRPPTPLFKPATLLRAEHEALQGGLGPGIIEA